MSLAPVAEADMLDEIIEERATPLPDARGNRPTDLEFRTFVIQTLVRIIKQIRPSRQEAALIRDALRWYAR